MVDSEAPLLLRYCLIDRPGQLPRGCVLRPLRAHRDARGLLAETLRADWPELYGPELPFAQSYFSVTRAGIARDEDRWHLHERQADRFVVVSGCLVIALAQAGIGLASVALVPLGPLLGDGRHATLLVPPGVLHAVLAAGDSDAVLLNSPTRLYDPADETRVPFAEAGARLPDGRDFRWDLVRADPALAELLRPGD